MVLGFVKLLEYRYQNNDMKDLESKLIDSQYQRNRVIVYRWSIFNGRLSS